MTTTEVTSHTTESTVLSTAYSASTTGSSVSSGIVNGCMCPCRGLGISALNHFTDEQMRLRLAEIIKDIQINKKETSLAKSKLISAKDYRPSAQAVGSLGVVILVAIAALIIIMDIGVIIRGINTLRKMIVKTK
jgi:hypothetical protein